LLALSTAALALALVCVVLSIAAALVRGGKGYALAFSRYFVLHFEEIAIIIIVPLLR
jgi:hypothetical protein